MKKKLPFKERYVTNPWAERMKEVFEEIVTRRRKKEELPDTTFLRFGLISYRMDGCEHIRSILSQVMDLYPEIDKSIILQDLPIYEIRIKSIDPEIKERMIDFLRSKDAIFKLMI